MTESKLGCLPALVARRAWGTLVEAMLPNFSEEELYGAYWEFDLWDQMPQPGQTVYYHGDDFPSIVDTLFCACQAFGYALVLTRGRPGEWRRLSLDSFLDETRPERLPGSHYWKWRLMNEPMTGFLKVETLTAYAESRATEFLSLPGPLGTDQATVMGIVLKQLRQTRQNAYIDLAPLPLEETLDFDTALVRWVFDGCPVIEWAEVVPVVSEKLP